MTHTIQGSAVKIFINGKVWGAAQEVSWTTDYAEKELYGIDNPFPQEIYGAKVATYGSIKGLRTRQSGGTQGVGLRPILQEFASSPYVSIRIQDRYSGEDLVYMPKAKVSSEALSVGTKGILVLNIQFRAMAGWQPQDRT